MNLRLMWKCFKRDTSVAREVPTLTAFSGLKSSYQANLLGHGWFVFQRNFLLKLNPPQGNPS